MIVVFFTLLSFLRSSGEHSGDTFFTPENQLFLDWDPTVGVQEFIGFNPFDTLRFGKIRLFERPNRGMLIRVTRCHEFTSQEQVLKCGSAAATLGFQWH